MQGDGVERTFPLHNPRVQKVITTRRGEVRRAKLYFLRDRVGKRTRLKELLGEKARLRREVKPVPAPAPDTGSQDAKPSGRAVEVEA